MIDATVARKFKATLVDKNAREIGWIFKETAHFFVLRFETMRFNGSSTVEVPVSQDRYYRFDVGQVLDATMYRTRAGRWCFSSDEAQDEASPL